MRELINVKKMKFVLEYGRKGNQLMFDEVNKIIQSSDLSKYDKVTMMKFVRDAQKVIESVE